MCLTKQIFIQMPKLLAFILAIAAFVEPAGAQSAQQTNTIENVVALQMATNSCGYKVNHSMLAIALSAVNIRPTELTPGGKHWPSVQSHQARVRKLIATESGKASFCRTVRNELSAMID